MGSDPNGTYLTVNKLNTRKIYLQAREVPVGCGDEGTASVAIDAVPASPHPTNVFTFFVTTQVTTWR